MTTNQDTKTCIHCKSEINKLASKCPHCGGKNYVWTPFRKIMAGFIILVFFFMFLSPGSTSTPVPEPAPADTSNIKTVFDLNNLYGKNIDQIVKVLGKPADNTEPTKLQISAGTNQWDKSFKKDNQTLLVTYNPSTRTVIDFFIPTTDPSGGTSDPDIIKKIAGVSDGGNFIIKRPRESRQHPGTWTGLIFVPK